MAARAAAIAGLVAAAVAEGGLAASAEAAVAAAPDRQGGDDGEPALRGAPRRLQNGRDEPVGVYDVFRSLFSSFHPDCWSLNSVRDVDEKFVSVCETGQLVEIGIVSCLFSWCLIFAHRWRMSFRQGRRAKRTMEAEGNLGRCPAGHGLQRFRWPGSRGHCSRCQSQVEFMWGCRLDKWGLCHRCYLDQIARRVLEGEDKDMMNGVISDGSTPRVREEKSLFSDMLFRPVLTVEITLELQTVVNEGDNISNWFDKEIRNKAKQAGIATHLIPALEQNVQVFDSSGTRYAAYEDLEGHLSEEKFPILFKYSVTAEP